MSDTVEALIQRCDIGIGEVGEPVEHSRISHQRVQPAKLGNRLFHRIGIALCSRKIRLNRQYLMAVGRRQFGKRCAVPVGHRHLCPLGDESIDNRAPNPLRTARHQCHLPG